MNSTGVAEKPALISPARFFSSSIGKKLIVAVSGAVLLLFAVGHMVGNLQVFIGQDQINEYAFRLRSLGGVLWIIRAVLFAFLVLHVWYAVRLKLENWQARPVRYFVNNAVQATLASRTMIWSGLLIFSFVTYHLLHFTFLATHPEYHDLTAPLTIAGEVLQVHDVYSMIILGFRQPLIAGFYILMMFLLAYHLSHGIKSMFQTMGLNNERYEPRLNVLAYGLAALLFVGYIAIPVATLSGLLRLPSEVGL